MAEIVLAVGLAACATAALLRRGRFRNDAFQPLLRTAHLGRGLHHFDEIDSTMTSAETYLSQHGMAASHGHIFLAEMQTAGRGRSGPTGAVRPWLSAPRGNIYMSFLWDGQTTDAAANFAIARKLNFAAPVAVVRAARAEGVAGACVKWPNDVWVSARKVSGMLVNGAAARGPGAQAMQLGVCVGIGINCNEDMARTALAGQATSLATEAGRRVSRERVLATVCNEIEALMAKSFAEILTVRSEYGSALMANPFAEILTAWDEVDMLKSKVIRVHAKNRDLDDADDYDATVVGIDHESGSLLVRKQSGETTALVAEEISVRPVA